MKTFHLAGRRRDDESVFLTSEHRVYHPYTPVHRNDYMTVVHVDDDPFKEHFQFNFSNWIYENMTGITWGEFKEIAKVSVYDCVNNQFINK